MMDCTPETQAERRRQLVRLKAKRYSGVQSVSDRSRSVSYLNGEAMDQAIAKLEREIARCDGCAAPRRLLYVPLIKGF